MNSGGENMSIMIRVLLLEGRATVCVYCDQDQVSQFPFTRAKEYIAQTQIKNRVWVPVTEGSWLYRGVDDLRNEFATQHKVPSTWIHAVHLSGFIGDCTASNEKIDGVGLGMNKRCIERAAMIAVVLSRALWYFSERCEPLACLQRGEPLTAAAVALKHGVLEQF